MDIALMQYLQYFEGFMQYFEFPTFTKLIFAAFQVVHKSLSNDGGLFHRLVFLFFMQTSNDGGIFAAINCVLHRNTNCLRKLSHRYSANTNTSHTLAIHVHCSEASTNSKLFTHKFMSVSAHLEFK